MRLRAVIFDLDGVITDTAEYHFQSWKRLADEEGLPFSREDNERLRGVSRRESLLLILKGQHRDEPEMQALMARKNRYYQEMLDRVTPDDLLPGVRQLLAELDTAGVPYAIASASRNAGMVVERLGIAGRLQALADGNSVERPKPAPDLFRFAAAALGLPPAECLVVEDAAAGIEAALAAGMPALALGPIERFREVQTGRFAWREDLAGIILAELEDSMLPDPNWVIEQDAVIPDRQQHMETIFTLGNGYFCSRGSFAEGFPGDRGATFAHGIFDDVPITETELVNLPDWMDLAITIDGDVFRMDQGEVLFFQRQLDLSSGVLSRHVRWQAPAGTIVDFYFERFASYTQEHLGAMRVLVTPLNQDCHVQVASGINGHVSNARPSLDVRHWDLLGQGQGPAGGIWLHSRTHYSELELAAAARITTPTPLPLTYSSCPGQPRLELAGKVAAGHTIQVDRIVSYAASRDDVLEAEDVTGRALLYLADYTYDQLKGDQLEAWEEIWRECDVEIEGDTEAQQALRFSLFQLIIAAPQHDTRVSIGAKTLSGFGYAGHVFWDTEIFVLPFFTFARPALARNMLLYRYHTLPGARRKAAGNGFDGAQYAWESATTGDEVTPTWVPEFGGKGLVRIWTGDIEIHISADIAYAIRQYWQATGDDTFMRDYGAEIILDTASFWADRAELEEVDGRRQYSFRDVIGPDEYHDHVDNNVYTNRMVQWHLQTALEVLAWLEQHYPTTAQTLVEQLDLNSGRLPKWRDVMEHVVLLHDKESGLMEQFEGFFDLQPVPPEAILNSPISMQVALGIEGANASQVIKQPDVLMLLCLLRGEYDLQTWQKNWETYEPLTDHQYGSSLGPSFHAWAACELNRPEEAYDFFMLAARADIHDVRRNAGDGIHAASAGGLWQAAVFGFGGLRPTDEGFTLTPRLPAGWQSLSFSFYWRGERQQIEIRREGGELLIERNGEVMTVER